MALRGALQLSRLRMMKAMKPVLWSCDGNARPSKFTSSKGLAMSWVGDLIVRCITSLRRSPAGVGRYRFTVYTQNICNTNSFVWM